MTQPATQSPSAPSAFPFSLPPTQPPAPAAPPTPPTPAPAPDSALRIPHSAFISPAPPIDPELARYTDLSPLLAIVEAAELRLRDHFENGTPSLNYLDTFGQAVQSIWRLAAVRKTLITLYRDLHAPAPTPVPNPPESGSPSPTADSSTTAAPLPDSPESGRPSPTGDSPDPVSAPDSAFRTPHPAFDSPSPAADASTPATPISDSPESGRPSPTGDSFSSSSSSDSALRIPNSAFNSPASDSTLRIPNSAFPSAPVARPVVACPTIPRSASPADSLKAINEQLDHIERELARRGYLEKKFAAPPDSPAPRVKPRPGPPLSPRTTPAPDFAFPIPNSAFDSPTSPPSPP